MTQMQTYKELNRKINQLEREALEYVRKEKEARNKNWLNTVI